MNQYLRTTVQHDNYGYNNKALNTGKLLGVDFSPQINKNVK